MRRLLNWMITQSPYSEVVDWVDKELKEVAENYLRNMPAAIYGSARRLGKGHSISVPLPSGKNVAVFRGKLVIQRQPDLKDSEE